jgi:hypothetical protein
LLEVLAQPQSLTLIVGPDVHAIEALRLHGETLVGKTADDLAVFNDERDLVRSDL